MMRITDVIWAVILCTLIWKAVKKYLKWKEWVDRIEKIPGPPKLPILGNALDIAASRKDVAKRIKTRFSTYGPIYRLWFGSRATIALGRAEEIEILLNSTKHLEKSYFYELFVPWLGDGLLMSKGAKWHSRRKLITPAFHFKILEVFHHIFNAKSKILVEKMDNHSQGKDPFDVYSFISHVTLDIICEAAMGTSVNAQSETQSDYVKSVYDITEMITFRSRRLWFYPTIIYMFTKYYPIYKRSLETLHSFTKKVIHERQIERKSVNQEDGPHDDIGQKKRFAFLDLLLEASEMGSNLDDQSIREEVDTFMFEGHDTTASGISWTLQLLGEHPECQDLVVKELNDIFHGEDRPITLEDVNEMKYLERVIKETMRMFPPVPIIGRILDEDTNFGDYEVPEGVAVGLFIFQLHRDPRYFPDPEKFDPDRFLPENCKNRHPYAYIPFSAGSRNCIGQKFAMLEEKIVLASILRKYRVKSVQRSENMHILFEAVLRASEGFKIILEKR